MADDTNVTQLPGGKTPPPMQAVKPSAEAAANNASLTLPIDVLAIAGAHLAIARAMAMVATVPNSPLHSTEQRIQDMAQRLGYVRGVLETAHDVLNQFTGKISEGVKP